MEFRITTFLLLSAGLHAAAATSWWQAPQGQRWAGTSLNVSLASHKNVVSSVAQAASKPSDNKSEPDIHRGTSIVRKKSDAEIIHKPSIHKKPVMQKAVFTQQTDVPSGVVHSISAAPSTHVQKAATGSLLKAGLLKLLSANFNYPALARRNNWEGSVEVRLRIEPSGSLSHIRITRSSGYPVLDTAALKNLRNIAAVPSAQNWLNGHYYDLVLPIEYRLIDG